MSIARYFRKGENAMASLTPSSRSRTLTKNTAALTVGRLGSKLLVFLLVRFYTYILTKEQYGTADLITSAANFLIPVACAGLSSGFFRFAAEARSRRDRTTVFSSGACILAVASMAFVLLSPLLYLIPYFSDYVWLIMAYVLCANLHYFVSDYVRAQGRYRLFAVQGVLNTALNIGFNLILLLPLSMDVNGYILSIVLADLCTSVLLIVHCRLWRYLRPGAADGRLIRTMLRYCLLLIPASVCWWITNASDRYMVTAFCGEAQNGLYAAAYKIPNLLVIAAGIFIDAWQFSAVTESRRAKEGENAAERHARRRSLTAFFSKIFKGYAGFLFLTAAVMMLLCRPIAAVLFDPAFAEAWRFIPVLLLATVLSALGNFSASVYMVERRGLASFITALIGAVSNLVLNFLLIPPQGPLGAAVATALSYLLVFIVRLISTRRSIPYRCAPAWLTLNLSLLSAMALLTAWEVRGWLWYSAGLLVLILALCILPLFKNVRAWLGERTGK